MKNLKVDNSKNFWYLFAFSFNKFLYVIIILDKYIWYKYIR